MDPGKQPPKNFFRSLFSRAPDEDVTPRSNGRVDSPPPTQDHLKSLGPENPPGMFAIGDKFF